MGAAIPHARSESGFTVIEVLVAGVILGIGLMGLAYAFTSGFAVTMTAQQDTVARQKALQTLESVLTGRNTANISFDQVDNVGAGNSATPNNVGTPTGIFVVGFQPLYQSGADGMIGTADDTASGMETITMPGPDGSLGTGDDIVQPLGNFQRRIIITDLTGTLKQIQVTIQYTTPPGLTRRVVVESYVSPYVQ